MIRDCQTGRNPTRRHLGRTHRVSVAWLHERFAEPGLILRYEMTHRQAADIYTKAFNETLKWTAACLLINIVDGTQLETLFRCFADHNAEQLAQDYDLLYEGLHKSANPKSNYMEYNASPSTQRRGGITNVARLAGDTATAENDVSDIDAITFNDLPLPEMGKLDDIVTPLAATTPTTLIQGDSLFNMEVKTSLGILKELAAHSWDTNNTTDLGLTSSYGFPRLGVHTLRHNKLIMLINFHA